ncbi:MAG: hypothetical protein AAGB12_10120 [Pseudomonadota bacterium]
MNNLRKTIMNHNYLGLILLTVFLSGCSSTVGTGDQAPDPVVVDRPIAYVKRTVPLDENELLIQEDLRTPFEFNPGAQLIIRERAAVQAAELVATEGVFAEGELYDVKDLETSYDGLKVIFSMRAPEIEDADDDEQPTWNIWEYDNETQILRRIIASDIIAEEGQDIAPHYLPDGRIVFSSTRQRQSRAILLDEGKPQYAGLDEDQREEAAVLHVMNADGSDIRQISFNQSHDLDPSVLDNGKIVFTRWDNAGNKNGMHLYTINPDGTELSALYGLNSHETGTNDAEIQFMSPRELPDLRLITLQKGFESLQAGGDLLLIDAINFAEHNYSLANGALTTSDGQVSASVGEVTTDNSISIAGRFNSVYPLYDGSGRLLVSWSQCRLSRLLEGDEEPRLLPCTEDNLADLEAEEALPIYGLYIYDIEAQTQLPIFEPEENITFTEAVILQERALPSVRLDDSQTDFNQELADQSVGVLHIRSVYDVDGVDTSTVGIGVLADPSQTLASERPARFLRIVKGVPLPDDDIIEIPGTAFGRSRANLMKDIVGYGEVAPDGSVNMQVPANIPFNVSILDQYGRRISPKHQTWIQLKPGESLTCHGCHDDDNNIPHGRLDALPTSINPGAAVDGEIFVNSNPALIANLGETMAQAAARINGPPVPNLGLVFTDSWTDETVRALDPDMAYLYANLRSPAPTTTNCLDTWIATCRITINYVDSINPLWTLNREVFDLDGITLLRDDTCTACHSPTDAMAATRVPEAQLDLTGDPSADEPDHLVSYRELLFPDNEQEVLNGNLVDRMIPVLDENGNPVFQTDSEGNLILDGEGNPIPLLQTVTVNPSMSVNGAIASPRFVDLFLPGGTHEGRLTLDELKLVIEWLDIGAQYYNNPFAVPQD